MPIARLAVAACALLFLAGCGVGHTSEAEQAALTGPAAAPASASPTAAAERSEYPAPEGVRTSIGEGVVLTTSTPKSFTPTDTAYPRVSRAVAIDMELDNGGTIAFRPSQLGFTALVDGAPAEQVIDSTQGYNGVSGTTDEVAPNQTLRFTVAFAVPKQTCSLQVSVRTDPPGIATVELFDGSV